MDVDVVWVGQAWRLGGRIVSVTAISAIPPYVVVTPARWTGLVWEAEEGTPERMSEERLAAEGTPEPEPPGRVHPAVVDLAHVAEAAAAALVDRPELADSLRTAVAEVADALKAERRAGLGRARQSATEAFHRARR